MAKAKPKAMSDDAFLSSLREFDALRTRMAALKEQAADLSKACIAEFKRRKIDEYAIAAENKATLCRKTTHKIDVDLFRDLCANSGLANDVIAGAIKTSIIRKEATKLLSGDALDAITKSKPGAFYIAFTGDRLAESPDGDECDDE